MRNRFQRGHPKYGGRVKGTPNKFTIGRLEAAIAAEHPEYTTLQKHKAVVTALIDRWEHTKRYTEAEGRALEALSKVLDRIMPYEHRKLSAGDTPEHPHHVDVDLSGLTDEELELGERLAIKIGLGHTGSAGSSERVAAGGPKAQRSGRRREGKDRRQIDRMHKVS
jgi:hypothetical protein